MNDPKLEEVIRAVEAKVMKIIDECEREVRWRDDLIYELKRKIEVLEKDNTYLEDEIAKLEAS
jgi:uncharacterized protein (DUF3084 family)